MLSTIALPAVMDGGSAENAGSAFLPDAFELRRAGEADRPFMEQLFRGTREFLYRLPLPGPQIDMLVDQQYRLQQQAYAERFPNAHTLIIELSRRPIGKIMLDERASTVHIIDLALEPAMRGRGYGTGILRAIQAAARRRGMTVELSVDRHNVGAKKLYLSLGFQTIGMSESHESMAWVPSQ
jgi:ribosomal protein S18 acetylase RimI-like enzyme